MLKILKHMLKNNENSARLYWQSTMIKPIKTHIEENEKKIEMIMAM